MPKRITYKRAGVNIDEADRAVASIRTMARRTFTADVLTDISDAENLVGAEASAVEHMNADHAEAVKLYATRLLGAEDGPGERPWRLTGLDPDGLDLARGDLTLRLPFPERVTTAEQLRRTVVALAAAARAV